MIRPWTAAACLLLAAQSACAMGRKPPSGKEASMDKMEWRGASCPIALPQTLVVRDAAGWDKLWKDVLNQDAPKVDFTKHLAAAVFLGVRNTGGYSVEFLEPVEDARGMTLRYRVHPPKGMAIQAFTQPYAIRLYPKTDLPVKLEELRK
jgi:hypothetical protein